MIPPTEPTGDPHAGEASKQGGPGAPKPDAGRRLRILLVEDHLDTSTILARLLQKMGHEVIVASTVAGALKAADEASLGAGIDLIVSDVGLPDGSGFDMMRKLSARGLPGVALTGFGRDSDIEASLEAGFYRHLVKPIDVHQLRRTILEFSQQIE